MLVTGKISPETYEEWNRETGRAELPERVTPLKKRKSSRKTKTKAKAKKKAAKRKAKRR